MLSRTAMPNWVAGSPSGPTSCTILRFFSRLSSPQPFARVQLTATLHAGWPFVAGIGQAMMGVGDGTASAAFQRKRLQKSDTSSSAVGWPQRMNQLEPSAISNSQRGDVSLHVEPFGEN